MLQVMPFSAYCLVLSCKGLARKLVMGCPAAAWLCTASCNHLHRHKMSQVKVTIQCPPFVFLVVSGNRYRTLLAAFGDQIGQ